MKKIDGKSGQANQLIMLMVMMFVMMFIFGDPDISKWIAISLNSVFYPIVGFDGKYPILTIIFAGIIVVSLSSLLNNFFADWKKMGKMQEFTRAFQKEMASARKSNDKNRVNKLMKIQPEIMGRQMDAQSGMMKPMLFLFIFVVPIFMWLRFFLGGLSYYYFTLPWEQGVSLFYKPFLMQSWLLLYMTFSIILGQIIRSGLKWISWSNWWQNIKKKIKPSRK